MWEYPDEGIQLIRNDGLSNNEKLLMFLDFLMEAPVVNLGVFGDQRQGKDAFLNFILEMCLKGVNLGRYDPFRIVTLGNIKSPPFVSSNDMYYSFLNIPVGSIDNEVIIYSSELENVIPSRDSSKSENRLYDQLSGTMAQNHQKLMGCIKLAYKVDINFIRNMNCKVFKYISEDKLNVEGVERDGILSGLGRWLMPRDRDDKALSLVSFDNNLITIRTRLPSFWSDDYSEQFRDIPDERVWEYIEVQYSNGMSVSDIEIAVKQKFRKSFTKKEISEHLDIDIRKKKESVYDA